MDKTPNSHRERKKVKKLLLGRKWEKETKYSSLTGKNSNADNRSDRKSREHIHVAGPFLVPWSCEGSLLLPSPPSPPSPLELLLPPSKSDLGGSSGSSVGSISGPEAPCSREGECRWWCLEDRLARWVELGRAPTGTTETGDHGDDERTGRPSGPGSLPSVSSSREFFSAPSLLFSLCTRWGCALRRATVRLVGCCALQPAMDGGGVRGGVSRTCSSSECVGVVVALRTPRTKPLGVC